MIVFFFYIYGYHRDLLVLTHSFPTRRSSDLLLPPAHQVDQPLHVLHDRPRIMDGVPFREGIAPFVRIERRLPRSVLVAASNPAALGIVELAVILRLPRVFLGISRLRSDEHTSELQSLMRISYAVFCLKNKNTSI